MEVSRKVIKVEIITNDTFDVYYEVIKQTVEIRRYNIIEGIGVLKVEDSEVVGEPLSVAEMKIVPYLVEGYTSREIAEQLHLSVRTIESHRQNIKSKLNVTKHFQLVARLKEILNQNEEQKENDDEG